MKKIIVFLSIILCLLVIGVFTYDHVMNREKIQFKKEYESYNNKYYSNGKDKIKYQNVNIDKQNNIVYLNNDNLIEELSNDSKIIFFASPDSNSSRILIPELIKQTIDNGIEKIYYYNIGSLEKQYQKNDKNAEKLYEELVKLLDSHVKKEFENGNKKGKKRIDNPTVIVVNKGKVISYYEDFISNSNENITLSNDEKDELSKKCEDISLDLIMCKDDC